MNRKDSSSSSSNKKTKKHAVDESKPSTSLSWNISDEAGLDNTQLKKAYKLLESGSKPYGVAALFGFHRSKIKRLKD